MKRLSILALVAVMAVPAMAQEVQPMGFSVKGGLFFPAKSSAKNAGNNWFILGVDYKLRDLSYARYPGDSANSIVLSADYYSKGDFRHVPVLANYTVRQNELYYFAGAGVGFVRAGQGSNHTRFAYQLGLGYDFQRGGTPLFVEGRWIGSAKDDVSGFAINVGIRL